MFPPTPRLPVGRPGKPRVGCWNRHQADRQTTVQIRAWLLDAGARAWLPAGTSMEDWRGRMQGSEVWHDEQPGEYYLSAWNSIVRSAYPWNFSSASCWAVSLTALTLSKFCLSKSTTSPSSDPPLTMLSRT